MPRAYDEINPTLHIFTGLDFEVANQMEQVTLVTNDQSNIP
jgi:hypothetical protein